MRRAKRNAAKLLSATMAVGMMVQLSKDFADWLEWQFRQQQRKSPPISGHLM